MIGRIGAYFAAFSGAFPNLKSNRKGVVLIAVLWISALVMWFALQISAETRLQGEDRIQAIRKSQALYLAVGGCYEAFARMGQPAPLNLDEPPDLNWQPDGKPRLLNYNTGRVVVIIEAEERKINVNRAAQPQLKQVMERAGADEVTAERLTDFIMDFIDQDNNPRLHGAEDAYYKKAGLNYGPFNGQLTSLDQLMLVPGITHQLFYGFGGKGDDRMPDVSEIYRAFLIPGKYSLFSALTIYGSANTLRSTLNTQIEEADPRPVTWKPGGIYRILSFGMSHNGPPSVGVWLTVRYNPQDRNPYQILSRKVF